MQLKKNHIMSMTKSDNSKMNQIQNNVSNTLLCFLATLLITSYISNVCGLLTISCCKITSYLSYEEEVRSGKQVGFDSVFYFL